MRSTWSRRAALRRGALVTAGLSGCLGNIGGPTPEERVRNHEAALSRFEDVETALEEGYRTTGTFVRTDDGVLGTPFVNPTVEELDPETPKAVLYGLTPGGQYEAYGLKWFASSENRESPPSLFGQEFVGPRPGEAALIPDHYALHVWLFRENPEGLFALHNPSIEPPAFVDRIQSVRDRLEELLLGSVAEEEGYVNTEKCIATDDGGYGIPFVREDADASGGTDPASPPILRYRLTANWSYKLLGPEWYVPVADASEPPELFGQQFHEPAGRHSPKTSQPEHYGLHAWLFQANPRGMFAPFNPTVTC